MISSPDPRATIGAINWEFGEDLISTVCFSPSAGVPVNAPAITITALV